MALYGKVNTKPCGVCGKEIAPTNNRQFMCEDCARQKRADTRAALRERYTEEALDRDDCKCDICGQDTNRVMRKDPYGPWETYNLVPRHKRCWFIRKMSSLNE